MIREAETDQEAAASGGNGPDPADLADVEVEDADRDKRYLPFGGEAHVSAGGGSGNFLFDIIRVSILASSNILKIKFNIIFILSVVNLRDIDGPA